MGDVEIVAEIDGIIRGGILKEGLYVKNGLKIGDIDQGGEMWKTSLPYLIRLGAVGGGGVLEGILYLKQREGGVGYVK